MEYDVEICYANDFYYIRITFILWDLQIIIIQISSYENLRLDKMMVGFLIQEKKNRKWYIQFYWFSRERRENFDE